MRKIILSLAAVLGMSSSLFATDTFNFKTEYHQIKTNSAYDTVKDFGFVNKMGDFKMLLKSSRASGDNVNDKDTLQFGLGYTFKTQDNMEVTTQIQSYNIQYGNDSYIYNVGIKLPDLAYAKVWYTQTENVKDNQQLDFGVISSMNGTKVLLGMSYIHNGELDKDYLAVTSSIDNKVNDKITTKIGMILGKTTGMILGDGWLVEGENMSIKATAGLDYKINKTTSIDVGYGYTYYKDGDHKNTYQIGFTSKF